MRYLILLLLFCWNTSIGQYSVRGKVVNEAGENLEFAVVFLEQTDFAIVTDYKGQYVLENIPSGNYQLKVTHTSYQSKSLPLAIDSDKEVNITMTTLLYALGVVDVVANKISDGDPYRYQKINKEDIRINNVGVDIPTTLQNAVSMVTSSDAGHGIGYSSLSIRGSDQTRINVAINGVPVNDAESQNVFWVNMPDLLSSTESIQIQRGVGSSANGPGAFGGSILVNTKSFHQNPYIRLSGSGGSFGTLRGNIGVGTGLMNDKYYLEGRYSYIQSDGYIDRASSRLNGLYFAGGKITENSSLRFQVVSGKEITYQAWNGVPEAKLYGSQQDLQDHYDRNVGSIYITKQDSLNLFQSDRKYNYYLYENQVDNYRQTQSQLSYDYEFASGISLQATGFYTYGTGFFEQFKAQEDFADYGFDNVMDEDGNPVPNADLARRKWLKNHYAGIIADVKGSIKNKFQWQAGLFGSSYTGNHFGEIVKVWFKPSSPLGKKYYDNRGQKSEFSGYARISGPLVNKWTWFGDIQLRKVDYSIKGLLEDFITATVEDDRIFFNPKAGLSFQWNAANKIWFSAAVAHKELARSDFVDHLAATVNPSPERMIDYELSYQLNKKKISFQTGFYYMDYRNQLVLNGNLNDVGAPLRINVPKSYRLGLESEIVYKFNEKWKFAANATISKNRILDFKEVLYDYTNGFDIVVNELGDTPIAYSPDFTGNIELSYAPLKDFIIVWNSKYVSDQFLDNTGNQNRKLAAYHLHGMRALYSLFPKFCKELTFNVLVNNILNRKYESFGYTYSYIYGDLITENFYFPQSGINIFGGVSIKF